ncbi:2-dehydro-3-deoxygalactonokinase [Aestuariivirga sp.]|uniref:2-dehydro-3-deoxygalactonokinase n=1 Tax=Aestuariivirga sp. TaxID=2650926 RepID=UPI0039E2FC0B
MTKPFIALDWGTTSFRAYQIDAQGAVTDTVSAPEGILSVSDGDFDAALEKHIGAWDVALPVLASGMITSRQGWIELPYVPCPAGPADLAAALHHHASRRGRRIAFATGLSYRHENGMPEVMRSEETQVFGSLDGTASHFVTPGTHSKWIDTSGGRITNYTTYVTGEVFSALKDHTILGRLMTEGPASEDAFEKGVRAALDDPAGFLHRIFATRTLGLFHEMPAEHLASFLSGQVVGTEVAHAMASRSKAAQYVVLASQGIGSRYMKAMEIAGLSARYGDPLSIVKGLRNIGQHAGVI